MIALTANAEVSRYFFMHAKQHHLTFFAVLFRPGPKGPGWHAEGQIRYVPPDGVPRPTDPEPDQIYLYYRDRSETDAARELETFVQKVAETLGETVFEVVEVHGDPFLLNEKMRQSELMQFALSEGVACGGKLWKR